MENMVTLSEEMYYSGSMHKFSQRCYLFPLYSHCAIQLPPPLKKMEEGFDKNELWHRLTLLLFFLLNF